MPMPTRSQPVMRCAPARHRRGANSLSQISSAPITAAPLRDRSPPPPSLLSAIGAGEPAEDFPSPSTSVGWAVFPDDGQDFETLMHSADDRMLRTKRNEHPRTTLI